MEEKELNTSSLKSVSADEVVSDNNNTASETSETLNPDTPLTIDVKPEDIKPVEEKNDDDLGEITFATAEPSRKSINRIPTAAYSSSDKDGITFATSASSKKKRKFPAAAVAVSAAAVLCIAAVGAVIFTNNNHSVVQTAASTDLSVASEISAVSVSEESVEDKPVIAQISIAEASYSLSGANKTNIVFGKNVTVEGVNLSGKTLTQAYDAMQDKLKDLRSEITITANSGSKTCVLTEDDFVFDSDLSNVLMQAYHYSRGELQTPTVQMVSDGDKTDFKITTAINAASIDNAVQKAAKAFDIQPVDAHVKSFDPNAKEKFTYADGSNGFLVDQTELKNDIQKILAQSEKKGSFSIEAKETKYKISLADIKANTKLIASHRTTAANVYASNENMKLAIRAASGTEVKPGETFSFNTMTGDTTNGYEHNYANGTVGSYVPSTAIVNGKYEQQYGGGICQASTTLYNCAMKADMEPVERHAHQFPSSYADYGLDATVDYGNLDMKFKNTKNYSVFIATYVYDSNGDGLDELNVEMYGPISADYDEIVTVGWVYYAGDYAYSAKGAKVYFKNGKEVKRVLLPSGDYDYHYDSYYPALSMIPGDPENGPSVSATFSEPTIYSPNGCGSCAPIKYGTAASVLNSALNASTSQNKTTNTNNSNSNSSQPAVKVTTENESSNQSSSSSKPESLDNESSNDESDTENSSSDSSPETTEPESSEE